MLLSYFFEKNILNFKKIVSLIHALIVIVKINNEKIYKNIKSNKKFSNFEFIENIIIGSGPSGSVSALELKKNNLDVLLIDQNEGYSIPSRKHAGNEFLYKWLFSGIATTIGKINIQYSSGSCFGGGSEINSGLYHRVDSNFFNKIYNNELRVDNFEFYQPSDLINSFKEKNLNMNLNNLENYFYDVARKLNWEISKLDCFKILENQIIKKNTMSKTYLQNYEGLNGKYVLGYKLENIKILKNNNCQLELTKKKQKKYLLCKNLFLCCGAPYTRNILKNSSIINCNNNFHFHPMFKILVKFPKKVNDERHGEIINYQITNFFPDFIFGHAASSLQFLKISSFSNIEAYYDVNKNYEYFATFHSTFSLGRSKFINLPFVKDNIINYSFKKKEIDLIKKGIKKIIEFAFASGAEYIYLTDKKVTKINYFNLKLIDKIIEEIDFDLSSVHLLGGLQMGSEKGFPLDLNGKLKNINANIYVNDSSLITKKILKNPQGAIMSIAKFNILKFLEKNKINSLN
jgi:hypothetical protein